MMSTAAEIDVSYGASPEFFRLWLGQELHYTCAVFDDTDDLHDAQLAKLAVMYDYAGVRPNSRVLDIGCGWGGTLAYLAVHRQVRDVHGITLSRDQHAEIERLNLPGVKVSCVDYRDYEPPGRFDALISICMIEHACRPEQARAGEAVDVYRDYFRRAWEWTVPGASFALQHILGDRIPRDIADIRELGWYSRRIFPGGFAPRMEHIVHAVGPYWEIVRLRTRRSDYVRTTGHWRARLRRNETLIRTTWGDELFVDFDRYLTFCMRAFEQGYHSLAQWSLRRID
ncbi:class I SAM-dependent methyltransferase [Streptomyces scopuliridis]|uniref:class I SAM-dependent methyltransferase n=1 Tax=Streptomyces scopuliridis TaxID=452529 RepID=UPI0036A04A09